MSSSVPTSVIHQRARELERRYGVEATKEALYRASLCTSVGEPAGRHLWLRVANAVEQLEARRTVGPRAPARRNGLLARSILVRKPVGTSGIV